MSTLDRESAERKRKPRDPIFYSGLRDRAEQGRRDAVEHQDYDALPVVVYRRAYTHAAAVAFFRARGVEGHRNRSARRRQRA